MADVYPPVVTIQKSPTGMPSPNSLTIAYSVPAQSGAYSMRLEIKVDNGEWTHEATITGSAAATGEIYITSLSPGVTYTIASRLVTSVGTTNGNTITAQTVGPSPSSVQCSFSNRTQTSGDITFGCGNYGVDTGGTTSLCGYNGSSPDYDNPLDTTTTNPKVYSVSGLSPNSAVKYVARAKNTQNKTTDRNGTLYTLPPSSTVAVNSVDSSSASFNYTMDANGGGTYQILGYRIKEGSGEYTSNSIETIQPGDGNARSGTFTVTSLNPATIYTVKMYVNGINGTMESTEVTITTPAGPTLYGSVNGQTKKVTKFYGSVNGQTKEITKLYGSVNGQTKLIYEKGA